MCSRHYEIPLQISHSFVSANIFIYMFALIIFGGPLNFYLIVWLCCLLVFFFVYAMRGIALCRQ